MPLMIMKHGIDPAKQIMDAIGSFLGDIELLRNQAMVAVYIRPNVTASGIHLTDRTVEEDRYQGKVGLLVKTGPSAFVDPDGKWFTGEENFQVGKDWLVFRPSDSWQLELGNGNEKVLCRIVDDINIRGRVARPDMVW